MKATKIILFIIVLVFSFWVLMKNRGGGELINQNVGQNQIILFYKDSCPHCAIVEEYSKENNIEDKISLCQKEVYYNRGNADELAKKAKICDIPTDYIGVPLLWDGETSKCFVGDQDIIEFFNQKINEK